MAKRKLNNSVVLATGNLGKVKEMQQTLQEFGLDVLPQSQFNVPEAVEDGLSFVENALIKARNACQHTGLPAIADDSGIEVDALNGAPGIYSSRYASSVDSLSKDLSQDKANNEKLLDALEAETNRTARFQCVIVYLQHANDPTPLICTGTWEGEIAEQEVGDSGFGYDPLFYLPELGYHSAELDPATKKNISHRAQALANLKTQLER